MFTGFTDATVETFLGIRFNNSKSWMDAHRQEYYANVRDRFYELIDALSDTALSIDPDMEVRPHKCLSRINRDIRFSSDKSLYRDHLWFCFHKAACPKECCPMFWFEFGPDEMSWGLGTWFDDRPMMDALRRRMEAKPDEYIRLLKRLKKAGLSVGGNTFRRFEVPPGLPEELRPLYMKKGLYVSRNDIRYEWAFQSDLAEKIRKDYLALAPFYGILKGCYEENEQAGGDVPRQRT